MASLERFQITSTQVRWVALAFAVVGAFFLNRTFHLTAGGNPLPPVTGAVTATWLIGGAVLLILARRVPPDVPGPRPPRRPVLVVLAISVTFGLICLVGALVLLRIPFFEGWVNSALQTAGTAKFTVFAVALVTGATEEVFFRIGLRAAFPERWFVVGSSVLYAVVTAATGNFALVVAGAMLGVVASATYRWVGRWYAPLVVHAMWTVAVIGLLPLLA